MNEVALIVAMILAVLLMVYYTRERFVDTSYYYEAAPGSRGSRLICMPEGRGHASLGIALQKAADRLAAPSKSCAKGVTIPAQRPEPIIPAQVSCPSQISTMTTPAPRRYLVTDNTSPGCKPGHIWDGKSCRLPRGSVKGSTLLLTKTSPGCPRGHVWDPKMKRCKHRSGVLRTSPGCRVGYIWDGRKCRKPKKTMVRTMSKVRTSPGCRTGYIWDGKKCRKPKASNKTVVKTSKGCPRGKIWDGKKCRTPKASNKRVVKTSRGCPRGKIWDGKKCRKPSSKPSSKASNRRGKKGDKRKNKGKKEKRRGSRRERYEDQLNLILQ